MHPSKVWYARLTAEEVLDRVPKRVRSSIEARIRKAVARTGSEMDFPKLTHVVGGKPAIRDTPPLIFHQRAPAPGFKEVLDETLAAYRETLARTAVRCWTATSRWTRPSRWWGSAASDGGAGWYS